MTFREPSTACLTACGGSCSTTAEPSLCSSPLRRPRLRCTDLARLQGMPVTVARGDATRVFYRIAAECAAGCIPGSTLEVVPDARHLLPVEDEGRFTSVVLDLLAKQTSRGGGT